MFPHRSVYVTSMLMKERDLNALITVGNIAQVAEIQAPLCRSAKCGLTHDLPHCQVVAVLVLCEVSEMRCCSNKGLNLHLASPRPRSQENCKDHSPDVA